MRAQIVLALLAGVGCGAVAGDEPALPDAELLEFLGSWEGEDNEWQDFFDSMADFLDETSTADARDDRSTTGEPD